MTKTNFKGQVMLMLDCLTQIFPSNLFALKGGTAINFFIRDMPRLSVDIDLTYLPLNDRQSSLKNIENELKNTAENIKRNIKDSKVILSATKDKWIHKIIVSRGSVNIKIEPNFILRGTVHPIQNMDPCKMVQNEFEFSYEISVLSFEDLYGGKICAALDRQHPRDLFDIKYLFENEGLTNSLRQTFIVYLLSHPRPIHEILKPNLLNITEVYEGEFMGMVTEGKETPLEELISARERLIDEINTSLTREEREFIVGFQNAEPDWPTFPLEAQNLPSIKWKLVNLKKLKHENPAKHSVLANKLREKLDF